MEEGHVSCNIDEKGLATIEFGHPSSNALPGKILSKIKDIKMISLDTADVVRHPIVAKIIKAYENTF